MSWDGGMFVATDAASVLPDGGADIFSAITARHASEAPSDAVDLLKAFMTTVIAILTLWAASPQPPVPRETPDAGAMAPMQAAEPSNSDKNQVLIRLSESPAVHYGKVAYDKQSENQRVFSAIWGLEAEVNNGGFRQYFFNSASEAAPDAPAAFRVIGAHHAAAIVAEALALFPQGPPPRDRAARQRRLRLASPEVLAAWEQLDRRFFKYPDNLTDLLYEWVKSRPNDFGSIP